MHLYTRIAVAGATAVGMLAGAAGATAHTNRAAQVRVLTRSGVQAAAITDNYNAGYVGSSSASSQTLTATLKVPVLKCTPKVTEPDYLAVFIEGTDASNNSVASGGDIYLTCSSGDTLSLATDEASNSSVTVSPGDVIKITVAASPSGDTESYDDETSGATASGTGTGFTPTLFQLTIQGGFNDGGVFPGFKPIPFRSVLFDGSPVANANPGQYDEVSSSGQPEIDAGSLINGRGFNLTFISG